MVSLAIPFPDDVLTATRLREDELVDDIKKTYACKMFQDGKLTLMQSAEICGMNRYEFMDLLEKNNIPIIDYAPGELEEEVSMLKAMLP